MVKEKLNLKIGNKYQRKGSQVIWTLGGHDNMGLAPGQSYPCSPALDLGIEGATQVHLSCMPKGHSVHMSKWVDVETFIKNWREVQ